MVLLSICPKRRQSYLDMMDWPNVLDNSINDFVWPALDWALELNRPAKKPKIEEKDKQSNCKSLVKCNDNKFTVKLDVSHFKPEEIEVKLVDNCLIVHGKHEEKMEDGETQGWVSREFTRRYLVPEECQFDKMTSTWSSNGVLTVEAPKKAIECEPLEIKIPICMESEKKELENGTKTPSDSA